MRPLLLAALLLGCAARYAAPARCVKTNRTPLAVALDDSDEIPVGASPAMERFGWAPQVDMRARLRGMIRWVEEARALGG
jgi:hypothetical protein